MRLKNRGTGFNPDGFWTMPIDSVMFMPLIEDFMMFDQTGYDLTAIERRYARANHCHFTGEHPHRNAIRQDWFEQDRQSVMGATLNHSNLYERKGYAGAAKEQLERWAADMPLCHKLLAIRPKWGVDFSVDWVDREGNCFEVLHWEYDCFNHDEMLDLKCFAEMRFSELDWDDVAQKMLERKSEWYNLDYFAQSHWKCQFVGMPDERFKMVTWK